MLGLGGNGRGKAPRKVRKKLKKLKKEVKKDPTAGLAAGERIRHQVGISEQRYPPRHKHT